MPETPQNSPDRWSALRPEARAALAQRDYTRAPLGVRLGTTGVEVGELLAPAARGSLAAEWIPGVEFIARTVYPQRHRGFFGEFARKGEGVLGTLGLWPAQWATARMFAGTAKGFHIHPPYVPVGVNASSWLHKLFGEHPTPPGERPYTREQWDVKFFVQGNVEMILIDERVGLPRRQMRFLIEGDDQRGPNNAGVVIPPGVAHALRAEGGRDVIMVYGTSTTFEAAAEGRLADGVERAPLPPEWAGYSSSGAA